MPQDSKAEVANSERLPLSLLWKTQGWLSLCSYLAPVLVWQIQLKCQWSNINYSPRTAPKSARGQILFIDIVSRSIMEGKKIKKNHVVDIGTNVIS